MESAIKIVQTECSSYVDNIFKEIIYEGEATSSQKIQNLKSRVMSVAHYAINMIVGPKGSRKTYIAELLHRSSEYSRGPFVVVDKHCNDYDKILFGYEIKATDVHKIGALDQAHRGTLYIEDVKDFPKSVQKKLLDYCVSGQFCRLGSTQIISSQAKLIFGSTLSYYELAEHIRPDFLTKIWFDPITLVPLKDRSLDIKAMIQFMGGEMNTSITVDDEALNALQAYDWPSNIHELELFMQTFMLKGKSTIEFEDLPHYMTRTVMSNQWLSLRFKEAKEEFEKVYIHYYILKHRNNISHIAHLIGLDRTALYRKMKNLNIS